jgi:hypothetical protein
LSIFADGIDPVSKSLYKPLGSGLITGDVAYVTELSSSLSGD